MTELDERLRQMLAARVDGEMAPPAVTSAARRRAHRRRVVRLSTGASVVAVALIAVLPGTLDHRSAPGPSTTFPSPTIPSRTLNSDQADPCAVLSIEQGHDRLPLFPASINDPGKTLHLDATTPASLIAIGPCADQVYVFSGDSNVLTTTRHGGASDDNDRDLTPGSLVLHRGRTVLRIDYAMCLGSKTGCAGGVATLSFPVLVR